MARSWPRRLWLPALCAITLLATVLRLHTLADANPWWDEGFTAWLAGFDLSGILLRTAGDTHPPLSYLLYHWWMVPGGRSLYALRFLSAWFGIAAVPVCAAAARRLAGAWAGLLAGLLVALSPFHVWWSQQIRMYALVALLCALSIYCLLRLLAQWKFSARDAVRIGLALGLANLVGLYTLYFFAVLIALESLLLAGYVLRRREWRLAGFWAALQFASLAVLAPWLAYFRQHAIRFSGPAGPPLAVGQFVEASWSELILGLDTNTAAYRPLLVALGALALGLLVLLLARRRGAGLALWLAVTTAALPALAYAVTLQRGLFFSAQYQTRYELLALPPLALLLAWGVSRLPRLAQPAPLLLLAGVSAWSLGGLYYQRHRTDDYQSLARFVQAYEQPGDVIVFDPDWNFHLFLLDYSGTLPYVSLPLNQPVDAAYAAQVFGDWSSHYHGLWLLQEAGGHDAGASHPVRDWLQAHLHARLQLTAGDRSLTLYQRADAPPRALNPAFRPEATSGDYTFDQPLDDVRPGDVLDLAVYASPGQPLPAAMEFAGKRFGGTALPGQERFALPVGDWAPAGWQALTALLPDGGTAALSSVYVEPHAPGAAPAPEPPLAHGVNRAFGGLATLTSYDVGPATPGTTLTVRLQWQAQAPFADNYTVFVHLLDPANHVVAQRDSQPQDGRLPTIRWQPGQTVNDSYAIPLPADLAPGSYQLELGLYLQATGQRLPLSDDPSQDHLILGSISVR